MTWAPLLVLFLGSLVFLIFIGVPVAFGFLIVNMVAMWILIGFDAGTKTLVVGALDSLAKFSLAPVPLFIFMGEILYQSGCVTKTLDALDRLLGRIPGRLSILSVMAGTAFAVTSGSSIANTSMLGSLLVPEMRRRGYSTTMTVGPILASGSLAMIIPPSGVAVILGSVGEISIGDLLLGGVVPGLIMAAGFFALIVVRCMINPSLAPRYEVVEVPLAQKIYAFVFHVLPLALVIVPVLGAILLGIATPTESAAIGVVGALLVALGSLRLSWSVFSRAVTETVRLSSMILMIVALAIGFSQALTYSGATRSLIASITSLNVSAELIVVLMLGIVIFLGMFLELVAIILITIPLFIPILTNYQIDPVWFGLMMLVCLDIGQLTPPVGMLLLVMKGAVPRDITLEQIVRSAIPFIMVEFCIVLLIYFWPSVALWLPSLQQN